MCPGLAYGAERQLLGVVLRGIWRSDVRCLTSPSAGLEVLFRVIPWVFAVGIAPVVFGWGGGHDSLCELAVDVLPAPIRDALPETSRKDIVRYSHSPDDFTPWEKQTKVTIHADDLAVLQAHGMKHPYALHSAPGQAVNFMLLTQAFQAKSPERIAYWSAGLLHTFADEAACNHDPLIHVITYAFKEGYKLDLPPTGVLDFVQVSQTAADREIIHAMLADYAPATLGDDPNEVLLQVMLHGLVASEFMTQRGARIARTFARTAPPEQIKDGRMALAELGVYGIRTGMDAICTAQAFAEKGVVPELTPAIVKQYQERAKAYLGQRPLVHDSLFAELVALVVGPGVGVLVEPSQSMDRARLGFSGKFLSAAIVRTLRQAGITCRLIDIRTPALPSPEQMPVAILCAGGFHDAPTVEHLRTYAQQGGRILLIGGEHRDVLGELSACLGKPEGARLPVTPKYGQNNTEYIEALRIQFADGLETDLGTEPYAFLHNPETKAGWQKPRCDYALTTTKPEVQVLARLQDGERVLDVAGMLVDPQGKATYAFLPEYLISPYLLSDSPPLDDPSRLELDDVGRKLLLSVLKRMLP